MSKYFEPTYYILLTSSLINWLVSAKDAVSSLTAIVLGVLTCFYMYYKVKDMILSVKLKNKELNEEE